MVDHEPLVSSEQLVRDNERANCIIGCTAAGISDDVGIPLRKARIFCRMEPRIHASENREAPSRRQCKLALVTEVAGVFFVRRNNLLEYSAARRHGRYPSVADTRSRRNEISAQLAGQDR